MPSEQMSQHEIDLLLQNLSKIESPEIDMTLLASNTEELKKWRHRIRSALNRYHWMLENGDFDQAVEARKYLHQSAFQLWLYNHGFYNKADYQRTMNKEAEKRGMRPPFKVAVF